MYEYNLEVEEVLMLDQHVFRPTKDSAGLQEFPTIGISYILSELKREIEPIVEGFKVKNSESLKAYAKEKDGVISIDNSSVKDKKAYNKELSEALKEKITIKLKHNIVEELLKISDYSFKKEDSGTRYATLFSILSNS